MRAGSSLCVDDRSFVNITSMTKTLKTPSFTFYHKTATKIIALKVCRYTDIRGPPGEQQHALCHVLKSKTSSKHCLSLGSAALWKPLIAKLLRCLRVSFWDSLVCCLPTSIPPSLPCVPWFVLVLEWCFSAALDHHCSLWFFQAVPWSVSHLSPAGCLWSDTQQWLFWSFGFISRHATNALRLYQAKAVSNILKMQGKIADGFKLLEPPKGCRQLVCPRLCFPGPTAASRTLI